VFQGILGEIDFYTIEFLFAGGKYIIEEQYDGKDPVSWYTKILEEQDIFVKSSKKIKFKNKQAIYLEIDSVKTPISEFTTYLEVDDKDESTLAWRKIHFPCSRGTDKECLGLAVVAREMHLSPKNRLNITLFDILESIIADTPKY
jgi:hypothetical protein